MRKTAGALAGLSVLVIGVGAVVAQDPRRDVPRFQVDLTWPKDDSNIS